MLYDIFNKIVYFLFGYLNIYCVISRNFTSIIKKIRLYIAIK